MRLPEAIGRDLRARRHTALLFAIVAMLAVRPFLSDTGAGAIVFGLAGLLVLLVALLTIRIDDLVGEREVLLVQRRRRSFVGWALLYIVIFMRHPEAFRFASSSVSEAHRFPIFIYFSFTTLSTIGFGDITPLTLQARYAAVAEGITGQFYLAVLVARLVGMQMSRAATPATSAPANNRRTENPDR